MSASELIRETRNVAFELGWHQGALYGPGESKCLLGLLGTASARTRTSADIDAVLRALRAAGVSPSTPQWNDVEGRTFDDVIDVLDKAEKFAAISESGVTEEKPEQ